MRRSITHLLDWGLSAAIALLFLVLMSSATSFVNTVYGGDAAIFRVVGSALRNGQELYVDVWDHKGPMLFFIEWLGQVIREGRAGIFAIQATALTASLALVMSLARRFVPGVATAAILALMLAVLSFTFEGGNLSEEFSLPFIVFVLYGALRALADEEDLRGRRELALFAGMGAAFAFTFFIRANNAMPIAGIFAGLLIQMLLRRVPVVKRFLAAVIGFLVVTGLIVGWFALRGTLDDMMNATFWFNMRYIGDASIRPKAAAYIGTIVFATALTAAGVIGQVMRFGPRRPAWAVGAGLGAASLYAVLSPTTSYAHYLTLIVPMIALGGLMLLQVLTSRLRNLLAVGLLVASSAAMGYQVPNAIRYAAAVHAAEAAYENQLEDVLASVPEDQRGEVFPWSLPATYYLMTDTLPTYKYFITQPWWGSVDPRVTADTVAHIADTRPSWVLVPASGPSDEDLQRLLDADYVSARANDRFELFHLK
ncbi:hypothetical protein [Microbacterium sp.]|uniref:hypothetical protein n=1 Tax=Microbacterium sp. TaxID=51671 RepID=UPI0028114C03|nr:hypothetical protein [Microbacterium sp.]